jgi:Sulfotransferase domain
MPSDQGIVVTGLPRSGTSWIGKMLEASRQVIYVNEPLNPRHPPGRSPGVLNAEITHRYQYICADNEAPWVSAFGDMLRLRYHLAAELRRNHAPYDLVLASKYLTDFTVGKFRGRRALIDDPFGVMSSGWFAQRMRCKVVVSVRQPVSVVGSWRKLGWKALLDDVLGQPLLMRDMFAPYADELQAAQDSNDPVRRAALLWRVTYAALGDLNERQPGLLHIQRYEDLANDPETGYRQLYAVCGLDWTDEARKRIVWATSDHGKKHSERTWTGILSRTAFKPMDSRAALGAYRDRLSEQEIERVHEITDDVAARFYDAKDDVTSA